MAYQNWSNNNQGSDMGPFDPQQPAQQQANQPEAPSFASLASGGNYWRPKTVGDKIQGTITDWQTVPYTEFGSRTQKMSRSGRPMWQFKVTLHTNLHDDQEDNGDRTIFLKTWGITMQNIKQAMQQARMPETAAPANGTAMQISYTGDAKPVRPGFKGEKILQIAFAKPGTQAAPQQSQQQAPQQQEPAF